MYPDIHERGIRMKKTLLTLCILSIFLIAASGARADILTFVLDKGSTLPDANYGTVTLTLIGNAIDIHVNLMASQARFVNTGVGSSFAFNSSINPDPTITVTVTSPPSPSTGFSLLSGSPGTVHMDGFGFFEYGITWTGPGPGGSGPDGSELEFSVSRSGGFSTVSQLVENSTGGGIHTPFSADVITVTGATGAIGAEQVPIPEPATMLLLGSGLIGLAAFARRRFKK